MRKKSTLHMDRNRESYSFPRSVRGKSGSPHKRPLFNLCTFRIWNGIGYVVDS